jgi:DNA-binding ferritin-like protein
MIADTANLVRDCACSCSSDEVTANFLMDLAFTLDKQLFFIESFLQK